MGSERKRPAPQQAHRLWWPKNQPSGNGWIRTQNLFLRFLVRRGSISGTESQNFWRKMSISTGEWMPRTALLRAVPSNSTTEPPLANNKGADFIRLKSVAPPPSHFWGSENRSLYRRGIRYF